MEVPSVLYHATLKENAELIWDNGFYQNKEGIVYLADSIKGAAAFLFARAVMLENIVVFEIDTEHLDENLFAYGTDHNPNFFKGIEVYVYHGYIDALCINNVYTLSKEDDNNDN